MTNGLAWSEPERRGECSFESAGWACRSTGFLWFCEARTGGERLYPCPRCNSELLLARAQRRAGVEQSSPPCVCCGPGVTHLAYRSALEEVQRQATIRLGSRRCES